MLACCCTYYGQWVAGGVEFIKRGGTPSTLLHAHPFTLLRRSCCGSRWRSSRRPHTRTPCGHKEGGVRERYIKCGRERGVWADECPSPSTRCDDVWIQSIRPLPPASPPSPHLAMMCEALVFPMPGGPLRRMALLARSLGLPVPMPESNEDALLTNKCGQTCVEQIAAERMCGSAWWWSAPKPKFNKQ